MQHTYHRPSSHYIDGIKTVSVVHERGRGIAWRIWPGAHVLLDWLENNTKKWMPNTNVHVVDIGAGVGLVGIVCAGLGAAKVTLTDLPSELDALKRSVNSNSDTLREKLNVMPLSFGDMDEIHTVVSDCRNNEKLMVVGSELIYWETLFIPIAETLKHLVLDHKAVVYIGYRKRVWKTEKRFFTKILNQYDLDCTIEGQWMAVEEDGSTQKTDGHVVYNEVARNLEEDDEWNTRVYRIFARPITKITPSRENPPQIIVEHSPSHKEKKKPKKIVHQEKKGRAR